MTNQSRLKGLINKYGGGSEQLATIGLGGCGFYGFQETSSLKAGKRVICVFRMDGVIERPVEVQGNIIYTRPDIDAKNVVYYGIEFLDPFRNRIQPIIDALKKEKLIRTFPPSTMIDVVSLPPR